MLRGHKLNNEINRLRERYLLVTSEEHKALFEDFLEVNNSVSVHFENLHCLAIKLYKVFSGIPLNIMKDIFTLNTIFQL